MLELTMGEPFPLQTLVAHKSIMASLSCVCGAVQIQFPSSTPRSCSACCCRDCQTKIQYLERQGGPELSFAKPISVLTLDNNMLLTRGKNKLRFFKLTPDSYTVNMTSTCCSTFLVGRSKDYGGNAVGIYPEYCAVSNIDPEKTKTLDFISFKSHWPEPVNVPETVPELWMADDGSFTGSEG